MYVENYRNLEVYKLARRLSYDIFMETKKFPKEEIYSLTDQIRRSSRSVGAQIAEAWAKRRYKKHFISKLTDADGEQQETQHWIETSCDCKYISMKQTYYPNSDHRKLYEQIFKEFKAFYRQNRRWFRRMNKSLHD